MRCDPDSFRWWTTIIALILEGVTAVDDRAMGDVTEGRTARPPRVFTDEHPQRLDPRRRRRRVQPAVRVSNPECVATGSSGALKTDVVSRTAAARTQ